MILRVPDYYDEFACTAGWCKDSCCIGWEIDIDEETAEYYESVADGDVLMVDDEIEFEECATDEEDCSLEAACRDKGQIRKRLRAAMYETEEGDISFRLGRKGRCPFLNSANLCDICICMGEEALSEVCTEYPRFSLWYGDVQQKCLSLSCEEAGRLLFSKTEPVEFVEHEIPDVAEAWETDYEDEITEAEQDSWRDDAEERDLQQQQHFLEGVQSEAISILQNRTLSIEERMRQYLSYLSAIQQKINLSNPQDEDSLSFAKEELEEDIPVMDFGMLEPSYEQYKNRFDIFKELEVLDEEWTNVKEQLQKLFTADSYNTLRDAFVMSSAYVERDYENLLVYFTFRYLMNSYYNMDVLSYGKLAVVFTLMIQDMDILRFEENGGAFSRADRGYGSHLFEGG